VNNDPPEVFGVADTEAVIGVPDSDFDDVGTGHRDGGGAVDKLASGNAKDGAHTFTASGGSSA